MALTLKDTVTWEAWVNHPAVGKSTQYSRKHMLELWARANGAKSPTEVLDQIVLEKLSPYDSALKLMTWLQDQGYKPSVVTLYRSMIGGEGDAKHGAGFFLSVIGEENFSVRKFNHIVPSGENYVSTTKKAPTVEELKHLLRIANLRDRALLAVLATTGMRMGEAVSRRMSDVEDMGEYSRIRIHARSSKTRVTRYVFLTKECVQWVKDYHASLGRRSEWLFPGGEGMVMVEDPKTGKKHPAKGAERVKTDHPLATVTVWNALKDLFLRGGLQDTPDEIYSPHSMRTFCEGQLRKTGLTDTYVDATLGHGTGAKKNYLPGQWKDDIGPEWAEKCSERMTWLTEKPVEIIKKDPEQERKIKELEDKFGKLTEALRHLLLGEGVHESAEDIRKLLGWDKEQQEYKIVLKDGRKVSREELEAYLKARERKQLPDNSEVTDSSRKVGSGA